VDKEETQDAVNAADDVRPRTPRRRLQRSCGRNQGDKAREYVKVWTEST